MPNQPRVLRLRDWYRYTVMPGVDVAKSGLYEWRIEGGGSYIGQYGRIGRPTRAYARNVARLIAENDYRPDDPEGFRRIHRELAAAHREGRHIELVILENGERPALNDREQALIRERGALNDPPFGRRSPNQPSMSENSTMPDDTFDASKDTIRAELERRARKRDVITYGEAAKLVGLANQGLRPILEAIMDEEARRGRPDLGCLVVRKDTLYPSYVGLGEGERRRADAQREAVFMVWADRS